MYTCSDFNMKPVLDLVREQMPCPYVVNATLADPPCLSDEYGKCELLDYAVYCPKYGCLTGWAKIYSHAFVEIKDDIN